MICSPPPAGIAGKHTAIGVGIFAFLLLVLTFPSLARAHLVEENSLNNRLHVLLWHSNPLDPFVVSSVSVAMPAFTSAATSVHTPAQVPPDSSRLAAFAFNVNAGVGIGTTGNALVTVNGTVAGNPIAVTLNVLLEVAADAPTVVKVDSMLGTQDQAADTDGDGVADFVEVLYETDPSDPLSMPGGPKFSIPALSLGGLVVFAGLLLAVAAVMVFRRRRGRFVIGGPR